MTALAPTELILIRHAPAATDGRLCGRLDVPLRSGDEVALARLARALAGVRQVVASPALRCRQTVEAIFPGGTAEIDERLWEQDFGAEDGMALDDLPDLGPMPLEDLAARHPPGGESFACMAARVAPALKSHASRAQSAGPVAVVAHAGTVRAGLALALGSVPSALVFEVAPLSLTRLRCFQGSLSIISVNVTV